jgi:transposase-like protein
VTCHRCQVEAVKFGINGQGYQWFLCKQCGKTFSDIPERPLDDLRVDPEKAYQAISLLCEGMGIRACERLTRLNRRTVLGILETAGQKCARLLDSTIRNITATQIETDELWAFVACKEDRNKTRNPEWRASIVNTIAYHYPDSSRASRRGSRPLPGETSVESAGNQGE